MTTPRPNPQVKVEVLIEDPAFVVLDKPAGVVSEPGLGHRDDSLVNGAMARWGQDLAPLGEARDHGLLHRLDRDTTGALVMARTASAYDALRAQFEARTVTKKYLAFVQGKPPRGEGVTERGIDEVRRGDMKVALVNRRGGGKPAVTRWRTVGAGGGISLLEVTIETGRLHQIRAHLADLGCPVLGDRVYRVDLPPHTGAGKGSRGAPLALHAWILGFARPVTGAPVTATAPVPAWWVEKAASAGIPLPRSVRGLPPS